jgi:uncharacterized protein YdhG (YjbR/CyaY superfamily)
MAKTSVKSVDEYIATYPENVQAILVRLRDTIRKAAPKAEEGISYGMAAYKLNGEPVLYFAGWKKHISLYPATATVLAAFKEEIAGYTVQKSTIRFLLSEAVPVQLVGRIAKFRAKEVASKRR